MEQKELSIETADKYLQFLFEKCNSMLLFSEIKISDYEPLKREYNDFQDRLCKSTRFSQELKNFIILQRNKMAKIEHSEKQKKVLKDGVNVMSIIFMFISALFTGFGVSVTNKNASEQRRTMIEEIRNNLSHIQFLMGKSAPEK
jgi:hypothetical protein